MGDIKYTPADSTINKLNGKMRAEPWYQEWFAQRNLDPNKVKLNDKQQKDLEQTMAANGFQLPEGIHVDPAGNWNTKHGWEGLPAVTKAAIITLAAIGTAGTLGAFGGPGGIPGAAPAGTTAATTGTTSTAALPSLASTTYTGSAVAGPTLTGAETIGGTVGGTVTGASTLERIGDRAKDYLKDGGLRDIAGGLANAGQSAANNRSQGLTNMMAANAQNISGENAFQNQQIAQAREEAAQRDEARKNLYRASIMKNPQFSVENPRGAPTYSSEMMEGMSNLEKQALGRTADAPQYTTKQMRAPRYEPLDLDEMRNNPSTLETINNWLVPGLSIADRIF